MAGESVGVTGVVTDLFIKPVRHEPMAAADHAAARARHGFVGDCHAQPLGPRQALIVRQESLDDLGVEPWQVRANLATRGLAESALRSGTVLRVGDEVLLRITHECEVCKILRRYVSAETYRHLPGRRGSLAVFIRGGSVSVGDPISPTDERYPEVPERIYDRFAWVIGRIPRGRVVTYEQLLTIVGASKPFFRVMPAYLKRADAAGLPAHRVLNTAGHVSGHLPKQRDRLRAEGVAVDDAGRVDAASAGWHAASLYVEPS